MLLLVVRTFNGRMKRLGVVSARLEHATNPGKARTIAIAVRNVKTDCRLAKWQTRISIVRWRSRRPVAGWKNRIIGEIQHFAQIALLTDAHVLGSHHVGCVRCLVNLVSEQTGPLGRKSNSRHQVGIPSPKTPPIDVVLLKSNLCFLVARTRAPRTSNNAVLI